MIVCQDVDLRLIELLVGDPPPDLLFHLKSCPGCREKRGKWSRLWGLMDRWEEEKPSGEIIESVLALVRADLRGEAAQRGRRKPSSLEAEAKSSPSWWASGVGVILISALIASLLSMGSSVALHYGKAVHLSQRAFQELGFLGYLPESAIFFLVGCLYGLLPLLLVGLILGRIAHGDRSSLSFWVVAIFLLVTLPYTVVECRTFALSFALSLIGGLTVGALSGGVAGFYLASRRVAIVS